VFIDAINVEIRDGQVANRPIYLAMAVTVDGHRDILGIWAGDGGEGAKHWLHVLSELKNRGVADVLMLVCDGLKGLPEAVETVGPRTIVQTCVVHLLRNSFRYAARQDHERRVDVQEVSGLGSRIQGGHLARDNVVGVQHRPDVHHHRRQRAPVGRQFDLVRVLRLSGIGDRESGEGVELLRHLDGIPAVAVAVDYRVHCGVNSPRRSHAVNRSTSSLGRSRMPWACTA
jgi:hypothetical protein